MTVSEKPEKPESSENSDPKSGGKSDSQDLPKIDFSNGEHKIATVFLNSEQKSLLESINNNLESFRENRKPKKVKSKIDKKHPDNETKPDEVKKVAEKDADEKRDKNLDKKRTKKSNKQKNKQSS